MLKIVEKISLEVFGEVPVAVVHLKTGLCNEVYDMSFPDNRYYIFRLNKTDEYFQGSEKYIPLFRSLGIAVPKIVLTDYSRKNVPYCYQIMEKIPGADIGQVFNSLNSSQLAEIAMEVSNIFIKVQLLPTDGSFGSVGYSAGGEFESWFDYMRSLIELAISRGLKTGILTEEIKKILIELLNQNEKYFKDVESHAYYNDIASKNLMVSGGEFSGLVDLDSICYGDYLEAIGRILADFIDRKNGKLYLDKIEENLNLNDRQKKMVIVYALLNRIFWAMENGIEFNQNAKILIDDDKKITDYKIIEQLKKELESVR